jgi:hypothetical protein
MEKSIKTTMFTWIVDIQMIIHKSIWNPNNYLLFQKGVNIVAVVLRVNKVWNIELNHKI